METQTRSEADNLCGIESGTTAQTPPPVYGEIPGVVPFRAGTTQGPPPSYEEANSLDALPPSYNSLFGQVKEVRRSSNGLIDFLRNLFLLIFGTIGCTVIIGFTLVIPLTMVLIGSNYFYDCPAEHNIPVFLVVGGVFGLVKNILCTWAHCCRRNEDENNVKRTPFDALINMFLFAWFIAGSVWVYGQHPPNYEDPSLPNYCEKTLYLISFWLLTTIYILLALIIASICCVSGWSMSESDSS